MSRTIVRSSPLSLTQYHPGFLGFRVVQVSIVPPSSLNHRCVAPALRNARMSSAKKTQCCLFLGHRMTLLDDRENAPALLRDLRQTACHLLTVAIDEIRILHVQVIEVLEVR